jgi:hypothetical protein
MSQTAHKQLHTQINLKHLTQAFALMGIPVAEQITLYGRSRQPVDLGLDAQALRELGIRSIFNTGIGLRETKEGMAFVYDHLNQAALQDLENLLPGLTTIGAHAADIDAYLQQGYTLEPYLDTTTHEFGVALVPTEPGAAVQTAGWAADGSSEASERGVW